MRIAFDPEGWEDMQFWASTDHKVLKRIMRMIDEAVRDPGIGIGKPERLSGNFSGFWSRRINQEHRLVYYIRGELLIVVVARFHYDR